MVVGARQSFQFFRQKTWFLGNNIPANIRLDEDVFRPGLQKTPSRHLQDVLIQTNMFALA